ncbi:MAG: hypothetical protein AUH34_01680 [Gemmatimonadetes bacterium 13_1_40CM_70_12]|nr:MAG: hypothetical protein AUH34_01680 [Gemmatimonadetes bacterium 13_1_40CM_70_12]
MLAGQILGSAPQVRLETHADVPMLAPRGAEYLQCDVDIARLLHVDPQERAAILRPRRERVDRLLAGAAIYVESEMRELDRHLARQPALPHRGEDAEVVVPHGDGLGPVADLLAELGEHAPQAGAGELGGGVERGTQVFPRQETPHRPPEERAATQLLGEPAAARGTEQEAAAKRHGSGLDSAARRRSVGEAAY